MRIRRVGAQPPEDTCIYMANHVSQVDILAIMEALPAQCTFIAKAELQRVPLFGKCLEAFGIVFVRRGVRSSAQQALAEAGEVIRRGRPLIVFPEGTRGDGKTLLPFKSGVFRLAQAAGVPVVPVALLRTNEVLPKDSLRLRPGTAEVCIGEAIDGASVSAASLAELKQRVGSAIEELKRSFAQS